MYETINGITYEWNDVVDPVYYAWADGVEIARFSGGIAVGQFPDGTEWATPDCTDYREFRSLCEEYPEFSSICRD